MYSALHKYVRMLMCPCRSLFFGDYMVPGADPRVYDEVKDFKELTSTIER